MQQRRWLTAAMAAGLWGAAMAAQAGTVTVLT